MSEYDELKRRLTRGWNTWDTCSVTTYARLPEAFALRLGIKEHRNGLLMKQPLIGMLGEDDPVVTPGHHPYDGSYTKLSIAWRDIELDVETATQGDDLVILVTPVRNQLKPATLIVESAMLWNRPGHLRRDNDVLVAECDGQTISVHPTVPDTGDTWADCSTPFLMLSTGSEIGISTGTSRSLEEIKAIVRDCCAAWEARVAEYGDLAEVYAAMQTCMAWDTIYEPSHDRVVSPVSREWSRHTGGYAMFEWDAYFGAFIASFDNKEVAYANAIEITRGAVDGVFVSNCDNAVFKSLDRSEPPVGCLMVKMIHDRYGETWFLEEVYVILRNWNRWWFERRMNDGLLSWGSDPFEPTVDNHWEVTGVNERFGASLESGLDNSPMYDDVPFDKDRCQLMQQDVGLSSLYVADCEALADIAEVLGKGDDSAELRERADTIRGNLQQLWDNDFGLFLNRRTDTGEFSRRISPTCFYPLLAKAATDEQAERMIEEHLLNEEEFWGDWVIPSIARNDPAYPDQDYWRGRIWAPMNFLVYLGLRNYNFPEVQTQFVEKSTALILKEWREHGHVHENYCGDTGEGCNKENSDRFYHWGGLLSAIALLEAGSR